MRTKQNAASASTDPTDNDMISQPAAVICMSSNCGLGGLLVCRVETSFAVPLFTGYVYQQQQEYENRADE